MGFVDDLINSKKKKQEENDFVNQVIKGTYKSKSIEVAPDFSKFKTQNQNKVSTANENYQKQTEKVKNIEQDYSKALRSEYAKNSLFNTPTLPSRESSVDFVQSTIDKNKVKEGGASVKPNASINTKQETKTEYNPFDVKSNASKVKQAQENVKPIKDELDKEQNTLKYDRYLKELEDVSKEKTTFWDKTGGTALRGIIDLGSSLSGDKYKYKDENGDTVYLPTYNELKQQKVSEDYSTGIGRFLGDATYNVSKILGSTGLNVIAPGAGSAMYWQDMAVDNYKNAINQGYDSTKSTLYSLVNTGFEFATGKLLGGATSKLTGGSAKALDNYVANALYSKFGNATVSRILGTAFSEGAEEFVQEYLDNISKIAILEGNNLDLQSIFNDGDIFADALYSAAVGAASGGLIESTNGSDIDRNVKMFKTFKEQLEERKANTNDDKLIKQYNEVIKNIDNYVEKPFSIDTSTIENVENNINALPQVQNQTNLSETTQSNINLPTRENTSQNGLNEVIMPLPKTTASGTQVETSTTMEQMNEFQQQKIAEQNAKKQQLYQEETNRRLENIEEQLKQQKNANIEENNNLRDKAKTELGTTTNLNEAGYLTTDGQYLDFSGKKQGSRGGSRQMDHREIADIYSDNEYSNAESKYSNMGSATAILQDFIDRGNIRLNGTGVEIAANPTQEQYSKLYDYLEHVQKDNGEVFIDLDTETNNRENLEYNDKTSINKMINDIKEHYNSLNEIISSSAVYGNTIASSIPTTNNFKQNINMPSVENNSNNNYNNIKGSDNDVSRTNEIDRTDSLLQNQSDRQNGGYNNSNQEQTDSERNRYVYSPKSYDVGSRTVREIFGEKARTNVDSKGKKLTEDQNDFYANDMVRNADGNLLVVYHGTKEQFDAFDKSKIGSNTHNVGIYGCGFYFTENKALASNYNWGKNVPDDYEPMALYVNITNPFYWNGIKTEEQMNEFIKKTGLEEDILTWNRYDQEIHTIKEEDKAREFSKKLQENGYDGIIYKHDHGQTTSEIVAFEPNQIKSVDNLHPTVESDNIYERTNKSSFSLPTKETTKQDILPTSKKETKVSMPMAKTDDVIKISNDIAKQINGTGGFDLKQRSWATTSTESDVLKDKIYIEDLDKTAINYVVQSNKKSLDSANRHLDTYGYDKSLSYVKNLMQSDKLPSASDVALMQRMIQEATKKGDYETAQELIMDTAIVGTDLGQATQALSMIQRLTPEGQLKMYTKLVQRAKARGEKSFQNVEITPEMVQNILEAYNNDGTYDQKDLNNRVEKFKQDIADQMKSTTMEKIDAWRYLAMLGNPKTHIRNIVSNIAMNGTIKVKNAMARTLETILPVKERTKTWKQASQDVKNFSKETAENMKGIITGENKYNEKSAIESKKQIFKNKTLEKLSDFNGNALEGEDWFFSKRAFQSNLQEYLTANGINTYEDIENNPKLVEKAKTYAVEQAEIATFRQYSQLAASINRFEKKNKLGKFALEALMPFKKTPINVAKAGVKYSPVGLIKSITYDAYQLKQRNINASQFIDNLSQGMTGTSLALLGYALAKAGILSGSGDDDKEGKYDSQLGNTGYSVNIGGNSYSISWLSPVAMPLLVGANAYEQLEEDKDWDMNVVSDTLAKTLDPLNEMSFMQGLTNALQSYGSGVDKIKGALESTGQNYVGQFFPTLFSQIAATTDDKKRSTKASNDSKYKFGEQTIRSIMYKVPGLRQQLEVATDIWGNEKEQSDNIIERAFENFIAPYSKTKQIETDLDKELKRVYNETGENGVIPSIPYAYVKYKDETYRMSAKEYTEYKKTYGQTAYSTLNKVVNSSDYKQATEEDKAKMLEDVYKYAKGKANQEYFNDTGVDYENDLMDKLDTLKDRYGISADTYFTNKKEYDYAYQYPTKYIVNKQIASYDKYTKYKDEITDIRNNTTNDKQETIKYINSLNMSVPQKAMFIKQYYKSFKQYDKQIAEYIANQSLTKEDKEEILTSLGFTIKNGRVYY